MKYFIATYGCQANEADSERIARKLKKLGHKKIKANSSAEALAKAGLIVINACSVRKSAMDRVYAKVNECKGKKPFNKTQGKQIILTGCLLESDRKKLKNKVSEIWHPDEYFNLAPIYSSKFSALVPIMTGCDNFCSYCAVPYTRGCERSRSAKEIINEVKKLAKNGYKEIWLLGQNVNSYCSLNNKNSSAVASAKAGNRINFPKLLKMANNISGKFSIHFLSSHPKDFSDELIKTIANSEKVMKEIHLPIQSGDNKILKKMNRGYTRGKYIKLINKIRKAIPGIKISTDIIVGFPGETKKQFQNTVKLFKKIKFDKAYVSRYSSRPETTATKTMKDNVSCEEKKRRWKILNELTNKKPKLIVVPGPTASGKSDLAVEIARKFSGEIISADSRQIYKGMDIGTGKIAKKEMRGIKHHLLNVVGPKTTFTAMDFKNMAEKSIQEILQKRKIPIVCGGSGFYIHILFGSHRIPKVKPDWDLRKKLEKKSTDHLFKMLKKLDSQRAKNIDPKNKRRLIRAIEIAKSPKSDFDSLLPKSDFDILYLGIKRNGKDLEKIIDKRVDKMIKQGLEKEVKKLVKKYGWTNTLKNTIGYQEWIEDNSIEKIKTHTHQYAKQQMAWFKKYQPNTKWIKNKKEAFKLVKNFLES